MRGYDPGDGYDEVFASPDEVRPPYPDVLDRLADVDLAALTDRVNDRLTAAGVVFGGTETHPFRVDPLPRLIGAEEWEQVARGAAQRLRALEAFVADVYGEQRSVTEGLVPRSVLDDTPYFERDLVGCPAPVGGWIAIAGFDLVRGADGVLRVLEDNLRTPSGVAYAQAAVDAYVAEAGTTGLPDSDLLAEAAGALRRCLEASAPDVTGELVLLTDGQSNSALFEHRRLAEAAGLRLLTPEDLHRVGDEIHLTQAAGDGRVRAIYRRTDDDTVRDATGALTPLAGLLLEPLHAGAVGMVNRFGTGVADDKRVYAHVDALVRHFLGEEPTLPSVSTYDVTEREPRTDALVALGDLVDKPRDGHGGQGVVVGPAAPDDEVRSARTSIAGDPAGWVVQDVVTLSTCPVVVDGRLEPRHVDLRVFAYRVGDDVTVVRGGLTRVALQPGSMVVNSSRQGGGKATWVVPTQGR